MNANDIIQTKQAALGLRSASDSRWMVNVCTPSGSSTGRRCLGFRVLGLRVLGFRVLGFRVLGLGF